MIIECYSSIIPHDTHASADHMSSAVLLQNMIVQAESYNCQLIIHGGEPKQQPHAVEDLMTSENEPNVWLLVPALFVEEKWVDELKTHIVRNFGYITHDVVLVIVPV